MTLYAPRFDFDKTISTKTGCVCVHAACRYIEALPKYMHILLHMLLHIHLVLYYYNTYNRWLLHVLFYVIKVCFRGLGGKGVQHSTIHTNKI